MKTKQNKLILRKKSIVTAKVLAKNSRNLRKNIIGYQKGFTVTTEALNHTYNARLGAKI